VKKTIKGYGTLYFSPNFPSKNFASAKRFFALIGIGANLGNRKRTFDKLFFLLRSSRAVCAVKTSPILLNPDFSNAANPPYLNAVIALKTLLAPNALLKRLHEIERRFGRTRPYKDAPRTLDLDIIFFETKKFYNKDLSIPHPEWHKRASVVIPMLYLQGRR
jgi:2-amino-4-hydroxy-6-hydroxymethyldihydropteridine diphosphokinase